MKVLFLDIDGVLLPGRAYLLPNQTKPVVTVFDPCAVSLLNRACQKQKRKIVVHSSWVKFYDKEELKDHLEKQGVDVSLLHEDYYTRPELGWRYARVDDWLLRHPEVTDFFILDDEPEIRRGGGKYVQSGNLILTDFDEGITTKIFRRILDGVAPRKGMQNEVSE